MILINKKQDLHSPPMPQLSAGWLRNSAKSQYDGQSYNTGYNSALRSRSAQQPRQRKIFDDDAPGVDITRNASYSNSPKPLGSSDSQMLRSSSASNLSSTPLQRSLQPKQEIYIQNKQLPQSNVENTKLENQIIQKIRPVLEHTRLGGFQLSTQELNFNKVSKGVKHSRTVFIGMQKGQLYCPKFSIRCNQGKIIKIALKKNGDFYVMTVDVTLQQIGNFDAVIALVSLKERKEIRVFVQCIDNENEAGDKITFLTKDKLQNLKINYKKQKKPSNGSPDLSFDNTSDSMMISNSVIHYPTGDTSPLFKSVVLVEDFKISSQQRQRMMNDCIAWNEFANKVERFGGWGNKASWMEEGIQSIIEMKELIELGIL